MTIHRIEQLLAPRDLPDFADRWRAYLADMTLPNPLADFKPDQWEYREDYDDQWPADINPKPPFPKQSVQSYLDGIRASEGRVCRVAA
jgi:hypothetical protein